MACVASSTELWGSMRGCGGGSGCGVVAGGAAGAYIDKPSAVRARAIDAFPVFLFPPPTCDFLTAERAFSASMAAAPSLGAEEASWASTTLAGGPTGSVRMGWVTGLLEVPRL